MMDGMKKQTTKVVNIKTIPTHGGAFAPVTEDGTIVVNGIVASSFSNPRYATDSEYIVVLAGYALIHRATFTQWLVAPVHFVCDYVNGDICAINDMNEDSHFPLFRAADKAMLGFKDLGWKIW